MHDTGEIMCTWSHQPVDITAVSAFFVSGLCLAHGTAAILQVAPLNMATSSGFFSPENKNIYILMNYIRWRTAEENISLLPLLHPTLNHCTSPQSISAVYQTQENINTRRQRLKNWRKEPIYCEWWYRSVWHFRVPHSWSFFFPY